MSIRVLVTGASGFVGSRLTTALVAAGHQVRAMTRHPDTYSGAGEPMFGDVSDSDSLRAAIHGVDAAYYLVHSLDSDDFEQHDAEAATAFGHVAAAAALQACVAGEDVGDIHLPAAQFVVRGSIGPAPRSPRHQPRPAADS